MSTKKYKSDKYFPDDWGLTPSEKNLKALDSDLIRKVTKITEEDKHITTKLMSEKQVENIKNTHKSSEYSLFRVDTKKLLVPEVDDQSYIETIFDEIPEPEEKVTLHSSRKDESDMIAVEPKNMSSVIRTKIVARTFWLRAKQMFRNIFKYFILLILL